MRTRNKLIGIKQVKSIVKHQLIVGATGVGKDFYGERLVTKHFERNKYKIIDFNSGGRFEGLSYSIPQSDQELIKQGRNYTGGIYSPKTYPHTIYMICGNNLKRYPVLPKNIKIVRIDENDLDTNDLINLLGTTPPAKALLLMIQLTIKDEEKRRRITLSDVEKYLKMISSGQGGDKFKGSHTATSFVIRRNIAVLRESGVFNKKFPKLNVSEILNHNSITTFSTALLDTEIAKAVAQGVLLKKIIEHNQRKKKKPTIIYYREVQELYKGTNKEEDFYNMLRHYVYYLLTQGRDLLLSGIFNAQTLEQVRPIISYFSSGKIFAMRLNKKEAEELRRFASIPLSVITKIPMLQRGVGMLISDGLFEYPIYTLTPGFSKKIEGSDILSILKKRFGGKDYSKKVVFDDEIHPKNNDDDQQTKKENFSHNKKNIQTRITTNNPKSPPPLDDNNLINKNKKEVIGW